MKKTFYSNGKLLITGEYLILDGAKGLALPTKFGQNLMVEDGTNQQIFWKSYDSDGSIWFEDVILFTEISSNLQTQKESVRNTLIQILHKAFLLNPDFITNSEGYFITTQLSFPKKWGLGTSSTLINNIAQWFEIDAFALLKNSFGGSGYDIACAQNDSALMYHLNQEKPVVERVIFEPEFHQNLYFVYLNKKQNSKNAIASYQDNKINDLKNSIETNDRITMAILEAKTRITFASAIQNHETTMSAILQTETVKEVLFPDFNGTIKSLGAWGGDFILVVSENNPASYFTTKGYETIIAYRDMIL